MDYAVQTYRVSERRACGLLDHCRATQRYVSTQNPMIALRARMKELAKTHVRYGYRRLLILLKREGWKIGKQLVYRVYCQESLQLRSKRPRRRKMATTRRERFEPKTVNQAWAMDFVSDQLVNGTKFRALTIVDVFSRESLALVVGKSLRAKHVVDTLNRLCATRRAPQVVFADNGSEFSGRLMDLWAYHQKVRIDFSRPGKPTDNSFIESFNGSLRDECLNTHWFESLDEAQQVLEAWREQYNESRPHMALDGQSPDEFVRRMKDLNDLQAV